MAFIGRPSGRTLFPHVIVQSSMLRHIRHCGHPRLILVKIIRTILPYNRPVDTCWSAILPYDVVPDRPPRAKLSRVLTQIPKSVFQTCALNTSALKVSASATSGCVAPSASLNVAIARSSRGPASSNFPYEFNNSKNIQVAIMILDNENSHGGRNILVNITS